MKTNMMQEAEAAIDNIPARVFVGGKKEAVDERLHKIVADCLDRTVRRENGNSATRKIKTLETLSRVLDGAGYRSEPFMVSEKEKGIVAHIGCMDFFITRRIGKGIFVAGSCDPMEPERWEECRYTHSSLSEEDLVSVLESVEGFRQVCVERIGKRREEINRKTAIGKISLPSVELIVSARLDSRHIIYNLRMGDSGAIVLDVHIVKDIWMRHSDITMDNLDQILGLVPYLIKRTDCIARDGMGFKIIHGTML